jgi:DnaJ-class molecular chaperone
VDFKPREHGKENRCPKCDGKGTVNAPPDADGDKRPAICLECQGTGKKPKPRQSEPK